MSAWLKHVKATMKKMPGTPLKDVLKKAKMTYKKGVSVVKYAVTGKRSNKRRRTKSSKKRNTRSHKKSNKRRRTKSSKKRRTKSKRKQSSRRRRR